MPLETSPLLLQRVVSPGGATVINEISPTVMMTVHAGKPACRFEVRPHKSGQGRKGDVGSEAQALQMQWAMVSVDAVQVWLIPQSQRAASLASLHLTPHFTQVLGEADFGCLLLDRLARTVRPARVAAQAERSPRPLGSRSASFEVRPSRFALLVLTYEALALRARLLGLHTTSYAYTCAAAFLSGASYVPREGLSLLGVTRTAELAALLRSPHTWAKSEAMLANVHAFAEGWASQLEHRAHMGSMVHIGLTDGCKWSHPHKNAGDFRPVHQVHMYTAYRDCMRSLIDALQPQKSCVIVDVAGSIPIAQVCTASRVPQVSRSE